MALTESSPRRHRRAADRADHRRLLRRHGGRGRASARRWSARTSSGASATSSCSAKPTVSPARCWRWASAPGDRVGIWSPNNAEWVLTQFATAKAGLILVNINPAYRTAELEYALNKVGCKALVTASSFKTSDYLGMLRELAPELASAQPGALQAHACRTCDDGDRRPASEDCRALHALRRAARERPARRPARAPQIGRDAAGRPTRSTSSSPAAPPASPRARR